MAKVWFVTGASRGFGRVWATAALQRGDSVALAARETGAVQDLVDAHPDTALAVPLDVTDRDRVFAAVQEVVDRFGRIDVVANNAGFGHFGMVEEATEQEVRAQFETNVFGALWVTQAVLPVLRAQGSGHILQTSSRMGVQAVPNLGIYNASKFALEAFSDSLAQEVRGFGIKVTLVEPQGYATDWSGSSAHRSERNPAYDDFRAWLAEHPTTVPPGQPEATGPVILEIVDRAEPPLRVLFGHGAVERVEAVYADRLRTWDETRDLTERADHL
ncbi:Short-chain dehydrogenase [Raineyella antarctica]|uniref:Short-chain dehydrogenase n=1 Tax=Raineyella antarctica TaxID=1577474 RepID=A0A1G6GDF0_9ACTN|nr:SDR family NAD(P)-dependent oxidoreductase [Raineyella antarctica]SDB80000.1 Short-chain dehydrogenase [Raineyella antarctica]